MKKIVLILTALCMILACTAGSAEGVSAAAAQPVVYRTADGVLSIQLPNAEWAVLADPNYWFAVTDGDDVITITHLSNGEALPPVTVAGSEYAAVCHAYVSTENEVFVIKGCAVSPDSLKDIMMALSTVKILKYNTKVAINSAAPAAAVDQLTVDPCNKVLYSVSKHLNVRTDCSTDARKLGFLTYGQPVVANGIVRLNGRDYGWYRINYNNKTGYVSSKFLSEVAPVQQGEFFLVYAENGGTVSIRDTGKGYYQDGNGHQYKYLHGSLYYRNDNDTTYSQDPTYWTRYQNSSEAFWVYAKDGSAVQIYAAADGTYMDAAGNTYYHNDNNIYYCDDTDKDYSPDANHWAGAEDSGYPSIKVYGETGDRATIRWSPDRDAYVDEYGVAYDLVSGNLYSRRTDDLLFSPDSHYWDHANEDEDAPYAVGDAFRVYGQDGSSVEIFERSDGKFADYRGHLYENTTGCIWYCDDTNKVYSTDPNEWAPDPGVDGRDYGENDDIDGTDYGENPDYGQDYDDVRDDHPQDDAGMDGRDYGENPDEY